MDGGHTWEKLAGEYWGRQVRWRALLLTRNVTHVTRCVSLNNYGGGNFLSEDGGNTGTVSSTGYTGALVRQVAVARGSPVRGYAIARSGLFSSQDDGGTWDGLAHGAARRMEGFALAVDPNDSAHILATALGAGPDPLVSQDAGRTWSLVDTGLWPPGGTSLGDDVTQIVFAGDSSQVVVATVGGRMCLLGGLCDGPAGRGIIVSHDGGESWAQTNLSSGNVLGLAVSPNDGSRVYAAVRDVGLHRSIDSGVTWELINPSPAPSSPRSLGLDELSQLDLTALAVVGGNPDKLYAGYRGAAIAVSGDGGASWAASASGMPPEANVVVLAIDPIDSDIVYAGSHNSGVYVSQNGGSTWTALNDGLLTRAVRDLALSDDGGVLYMASEGGGVFRLGTPQVPTGTPTWTPSPTVTSTPTVTTTPFVPTVTQTPTLAATITPTRRPCEDVLPHGDFEAGFLAPWSALGEAQVTSVRAHGGERSALVGSANNAVDELVAGIGILPDATSVTLSYWWYVESSDPEHGADRLIVVVDTGDVVVPVETLTNDSPKDAWHRTTFDLSGLAGQFVGLVFRAETDAADATSFFLDDVQVQVCSAPLGQRTYLPLVMKGD